MGNERESRPSDPLALPELTPDQRASREAENGIRQFDRLLELIDKGINLERFRLRISHLMELNRFAVEGLVDNPGALRQVSIFISDSKHEPPQWESVPKELEDLCDYVNDNWAVKSATHLAAYVMWRLNWIHPWVDGNGRTSRAISYLVMCIRSGLRFPGTKTIPERIANDKFPYYDALEAADRAWNHKTVDLAVMEDLLSAHLAAQLMSIYEAATSCSETDKATE